MSAPVLLRSYRFVFAILLLAASALTLFGSEHEASVLAEIEIAGILLFVWRRSRYLGAAILLGVFAFAEFLSLRHGQFPTQFLQYAAAVVFLTAMDVRLPHHR